ncbi:MAG: hypothetical protein ACLQU3_23240, partial [Limisphaerales bacterium]
RAGGSPLAPCSFYLVANAQGVTTPTETKTKQSATYTDFFTKPLELASGRSALWFQLSGFIPHP